MMTRRRWILAAAIIAVAAAFIAWGVWWAERGASEWSSRIKVDPGVDGLMRVPCPDTVPQDEYNFVVRHNERAQNEQWTAHVSGPDPGATVEYSDEFLELVACYDRSVRDRGPSSILPDPDLEPDATPTPRELGNAD